MPTLLDVEQAAQILGVSRFMIYKLVKMKQLGSYRVGTCVRISEEQLEEFLKRTAVKPAVAPARAAS